MVQEGKGGRGGVGKAKMLCCRRGIEEADIVDRESE